MKNKLIILFLLSIAFLGSVPLYSSDPIDPTEYIKFVKEHGFWAMTDTNKLLFCFGVDLNGKPACASAPAKYVIIELPNNLQK